MKRTGRNAVVVLAVLTLGLTSRANAQMGAYQGPVSPYINILRGGASPAINWFNIVQPQIAFDNAITQLQVQQSALGQALTTPTALGMTTGHPVMFGNYSHYYTAGRMGTGGSTTGGIGMAGMGMGGMGIMGGMGTGGMGMMGGSGMGGIGMMGGSGMGGMPYMPR